MASTDSTQDRIVAAARDEFARYGIAGARVDRIAKAARTSKERIYAYFRGKEELYQHVAAAELAAAADAAHLDPADLPAYAGRLFDYFSADPDRYRFIAWGRLELAPATGGPRRDILQRKVATIRRAQEAGDLDPTWDPAHIMAIVCQLAYTWLDQVELAAIADQGATGRDAAGGLDARRATVVRAVTALFPPSARRRRDS